MVKIELYVPAGLHRFLEAAAGFTDLREEEMNEYVVKCLTQGVLDSLNPDCDGVKLFSREMYHRIRDLYGLEEAVQEQSALKRGAVAPEHREFVRSELARLAEWTRDAAKLKGYDEIRRFLREMLEISV